MLVSSLYRNACGGSFPPDGERPLEAGCAKRSYAGTRFSAVYSYYRGRHLPDEPYLTNALLESLPHPDDRIASNEEDVPFDLRRIRVILYDQSGPVQGQKLIDKVAGQHQFAIDNPEDAIFKIKDAS